MGCTGSSAQSPYKGTLTELRSLQDTIEALSERISATLRRSEKLIDSIRDSVYSYEQLGATKFAALERYRGDVPHTNINRQLAVNVQNSMEIVATNEVPRFRATNASLVQQLKKLDSDRRAIEARFKSLSRLIESRQSAEMSLRSAQEKGTTTDKEREKLDELNRKVAHLQAESKDSEKRCMEELETFQAEVDQVAKSAQEYVDSVQHFLDSICTSLNAKPAPPQNHFSSLHPSEASPVGKEASFRNSSSCPDAGPVSNNPPFNSCTADLPPSQDDQQAPATKISVGRTQTSEAAWGFDSAARVSPAPQEPADGEDIYNMQPPTQRATV